MTKVPEQTTSKTLRMVDVVFENPGSRKRWRFPVAIVFAIAIHGFLWVLSRQPEKLQESWVLALADRVHTELGHEHNFDIEQKPPPPLPPKSKTKAPAGRISSKRIPAKAASIIAKEVDANAPVDLTGETFVTGKADAYAGGVTSAKGTSSEAVASLDQSRTILLHEQNWSCPWPKDADAEQINEQTVVIRVVVRADGTAESASIVTDPGYGFGQAAITCAMETQFDAAISRDGQPIRTQSPPIRVRFTR